METASAKIVMAVALCKQSVQNALVQAISIVMSCVQSASSVNIQEKTVARVRGPESSNRHVHLVMVVDKWRTHIQAYL